MAKKLSEEEMRQFLDCYNPEFRGEGNGLLSDCPQKKEIEEKDIALIYRWKLGRIKKDDVEEIKENIEKFRQVIRDAKNAGSEVSAIKSLTEIKGCGLAVASAILSVYYPNKFSIIDWRVLEGLGYKDTKPKTNNWNAKSYWEEFIPKIREFAKIHGVDLRTADKILWGKSLSVKIDSLLR